MLVLGRREGERVFLGRAVVVQVVRCSGGQIKLGVEAPKFLAVHREEVAPPPAEPALLAAEFRQLAAGARTRADLDLLRERVRWCDLTVGQLDALGVTAAVDARLRDFNGEG